MYRLTSLNITNVCGPGGGSTSTNWIKYFNHVENAFAYAEQDYGDKISFQNNMSRGSWHSGDLLYVAYVVQHVQAED